MAIVHALPPALEAYRADFDALADAAQETAAPLSDEQFNWQPESGRWSVSQCLEHLNATARAYLPVLDDAISEAIRRGVYGPGPYRYNFLGRRAVRWMEPPVTHRFKAPQPFLPQQRRNKQETIPAFRAYQIQYIDRLRQANGLDLARARVHSPLVGYTWIRIPLGSAFAMMIAHERRHLWQARQVLAARAFPTHR
jgi:DinB superfamily